MCRKRRPAHSSQYDLRSQCDPKWSFWITLLARERVNNTLWRSALVQRAAKPDDLTALLSGNRLTARCPLPVSPPETGEFAEQSSLSRHRESIIIGARKTQAPSHPCRLPIPPPPPVCCSMPRSSAAPPRRLCKPSCIDASNPRSSTAGCRPVVGCRARARWPNSLRYRAIQ